MCVYSGPTLVLSNDAKGFSPLLQISQSVVPKLHLSAARLRLAGSVTHSGDTQGILSTRTVNTKQNTTVALMERWRNAVRVTLALTLFGQDSNADARVAQFDEGRVSSPPVILSDQENIFSTHIAMDKILLFLWKQEEAQSFQNRFPPKTSRENTDSYQEVHGLSKLLGHLQLPKDVYRVLVLLQVGVQRTKFDILLYHYI